MCECVLPLAVRGLDATQWYPSRNCKFIFPQNEEELTSLQTYLISLENGSALPVRGRDFNLLGGVTEWDYGVAFKYTHVREEIGGGRMLVVDVERNEDRESKKKKKGEEIPSILFMWESGLIERFAINVVNFIELVHFVHSEGLEF
jgi:hypothetical protein